MPHLISQLQELSSIKRAPAVWREQTRERLLAQIKSQTPVKYTWQEVFKLRVQYVQRALAPLPLAQVGMTLVVLLVAGVPFTQAAYNSIPGSTLYPFKRFGERIELTLKSTAGSQGLYHLKLADNRLQEIAAIKQTAPQHTVAKIMRDYNVAIGFAQASVQAAVPTSDLAVQYNIKVDDLVSKMHALNLPSKNIPAFVSALAITDKLNRDSLSLLVSLHQSGRDGDLPNGVSDRLQKYITKLETKLAGVDRQITSLANNNTAKVVIESKQIVVPVREASRQAKTVLTEAKQLVQKNLFTLALQKVEEGEDITTRTENAVIKKEEATQAETTVKDVKNSDASNDSSVIDSKTDTQPAPKVNDSTTKTDESIPVKAE